MRVPVAGCASTSTCRPTCTAGDLEQALVDLGIEVESVVDLRATVTGPLVVGEVREIEELTGFKKPIRFCRVDVGDANGTGEPQEIVCGARNFAAGRPGRGDPARRRAARRVRHRRPQDVRAQLRTA